MYIYSINPEYKSYNLNLTKCRIQNLDIFNNKRI